MKKEITTEGIQDKNKEIVQGFIEFVEQNKEFKDNNTILVLILNKINSNLNAAIFLSTYLMFNEAKIIIRSAFESLVLFEYLLEFPQKLERYRIEDFISSFHGLFNFYKRGFLDKKGLIEAYNSYGQEIRKEIPFADVANTGLITYNDKKLEEYFRGGRKGFKPLCQQVNMMLKKLKENQSPCYQSLYLHKIDLYNFNAQVSHTRLATLLRPVKKLDDKEILIEIQNIFRSAACIYQVVLETFEQKYEYNISDFMNLIYNMMSYLDFDIIKELESKPQEKQLIEIVHYLN